MPAWRHLKLSRTAYVGRSHRGLWLYTVAILLPQPAAYCSKHLNIYHGSIDNGRVRFAKGTTTLAFKFKGGVLVSVDSRSTQGPYIGAFGALRCVSDRAGTDKLCLGVTLQHQRLKA